MIALRAVCFWITFFGFAPWVGGETLLVVIDTGVSSSQVVGVDVPLQKALVAKDEKPLSWDFIRTSHDYTDENGHGTHVSGIVWRELLARSPEQPASLVMLRAGRDRLQAEKLIDALKKVSELQEGGHKVPVVLCAFALTKEDATPDQYRIFSDALLDLLDRGTVVVAATAGLGRNLDQLADKDQFLPGCLRHPNLLTITACSKDGFLAPRGSFGKKTIFAAAHGTQVTSLWLEGGQKTLSGSSQAAAYAAAEVFHCLTRETDPANLSTIREVVSKRARLHPSLLGKTSSQKFLGPVGP